MSESESEWEDFPDAGEDDEEYMDEESSFGGDDDDASEDDYAPKKGKKGKGSKGGASATSSMKGKAKGTPKKSPAKSKAAPKAKTTPAKSKKATTKTSPASVKTAVTTASKRKQAGADDASELMISEEVERRMAQDDADMNAADEDYNDDDGDAEADDDDGDDDSGAPSVKKRKTATKAKPAAKATGKKAAATKTAATKAPSTKKSATKKVKTVPDSQAPGIIEEYLLKQNRPYSYLQVFENLHQIVKKTTVKKTLEQLATAGTLTCYTFNKTALYVISQDRFPALDPEAIAGLDTEIKECKAEVEEVKSRVLSTTKEVNDLEALPTTSDAQQQLELLQQQIEQKRNKLRTLEGGDVKLVSAEERNAVAKKLENFWKHWKKRRGAALEMIDAAMGDECEKSTKDFMEEKGLDSDEAVGVDYKAMSDFMRKQQEMDRQRSRTVKK